MGSETEGAPTAEDVGDVAVKKWNDNHPQLTWKPLSEWLKTDHKYFWLFLDREHEPEIIWICDNPNTFFCKAGLFDNLANIVHKLALPIFVPRVPHG